MADSADHSPFSPSAAHRWMACAGSIAAEAGFLDTVSPYAEEGTRAHDLASLCLTQGLNTDDLPEDGTWSIYPRDMRLSVQEYLDYCRALEGEQPRVEARLDLGAWVPGGFGTVDFGCVSYFPAPDLVHVVDFKYGKGVSVEAERNPQLMLYALGLYSEYFLLDPQRFCLHIVQPRLNHFDWWEVSLETLLEFGAEASRAAQAASQPDAPRTPGEKQCRFCRARHACEDLAHHVYDLTEEPATDDSVTLAAAMSQVALVRLWADAVEEASYHLVAGGGDLPGWKLVEGRSFRRWKGTDAEVALNLERAGLDPWEKSLLSVAQAEKALGRKRFSTLIELVEKPVGKPTLAPNSDKRPALNNALAGFTAVSKP